MIIDFHTHTFPEKIAARALQSLSEGSHTAHFTDGTTEGLRESMRTAGIDRCVSLAVATRADQVAHINDRIIANQAQNGDGDIIAFGAMHPDMDEYVSELGRLKAAGIRGIKLHPAFCGLDLTDIRFKRIIEKASELDLIVVTHGGVDIGFPDHDYASVDHILEIMREVAPGRLVLAHMGGWQNWDNVRKYLAGAPLWLDTAFSLGNVPILKGQEDEMPYKYQMDMGKFKDLVYAHSVDRVLFATDSPWADQREYVDFVRRSITDESVLNKILGENAKGLLNI